MTSSASMMAVILVVFLSTLLVLLLLSKSRHWYFSRQLVGPRALPIIGNILQLQGNGNHTFKLMVASIKKYGSVVRFWLGPKLLIIITDPSDVQLILGNNKIRNRDQMMTNAMLPFLGNGLFSSRDEVWKTHRRFITPTFHFKILQSYVEIFGSRAGLLCDILEGMSDGRTVDIHHHLSLCTMDAICETAIGVRMNTQVEGGSAFYYAIGRVSELIHNRLVKPWLLLPWFYSLTSDGREASKMRKVINDFTDNIIAKKLLDYRRTKQRVNDQKAGEKEVKTLLDMLIKASEDEGSVLTQQEIRDEVTTVAVAGVDTGANTLSNMCLLLGMHPLVQDEISRELDEIFQGDIRPATMADINRMEYTGRVLKETLRLIPVAPVLVRELNDDITLTSGQVLPAGSAAIVFNYMVHRDARYFPDPELFLPDRWLNESACAMTHPYAYIPFSAGPRNCIGQKYAILQLKSIISSLLRRFRVSTEYKMEDLKKLDLSASLKLSTKYEIQLQKKRT